MKALVLLALLIFPGAAISREYSPLGLEDKVRESDFIVVAKAKSVDNKFSFEPGMEQIYAVAEVMRTIKGKVGRRIRFITHGFTPEFNPKCCKAGAEYLIFGKFGFGVFGTEGGVDKIFIRETSGYASSADGPFGAFLVVRDQVTDRNLGGTKSKNLEDLVRLIEKATTAAKQKETGD